MTKREIKHIFHLLRLVNGRAARQRVEPEAFKEAMDNLVNAYAEKRFGNES